MRSTNSYRIRDFYPDNQAEVERMNLMFYHPQVLYAMGYKKRDIDPLRAGDLQKSDRRMFETLSVVTREFQDVWYAVADAKNKLVGWVWFCHDAKHPLPRSVAKKLGLKPNNYRAYQLVYQKLMSEDWPKTLVSQVVHVHPKELQTPRKGVIVEGLRLAIGRLKRSYRRLYVRKRKLVLYAYVLPDNVASQKVLAKNGFGTEERSYSYDGLIHELWVRIS